MNRYNPKEIEPKWQAKWAEDKIYEAEDNSTKPKRYIMEYFPYPSGAAMHVGHVRNYTIGDALTRHARMNGQNVLHPMGWDAFGLPAENYAIKTGISPQEAIKQNTGRFKQQLTQMGFGYDWSREFASSDPEYYRWTQWFFLLLYKRGLAYQKESPQWWCPVDKTVLANEQVENGKCWRCGSEVEKKSLNQWFFKITDYADRLEKDLDDVDWSDGIKSMQRNWIGHKTGINITYIVTNAKSGGENTFLTPPNDTFNPNQPPKGSLYLTPDPKNDPVYTVVGKATKVVGEYFWLVNNDTKQTYAVARVDAVNEKRFDQMSELERKIWSKGGSYKSEDIFTVYDYSVVAYTLEVFTTRPDTNYGATFVVLAPEHPFVQKVMSQEIVPSDGQSHWQAVEHYVQKALSKSELERKEEGRLKTGAFTGFYVTNPLNDKKMPVWVSDFVLAGFGTGAVVGVPGHDMRDFEFAKEFGLAVERVVVGVDGDTSPITKPEQVQEKSGKMINSGSLDGLDIHEATEKMKDLMEEKGMGTRTHSYSIRDWLISRQRYWGAPIPMIHCATCVGREQNLQTVATIDFADSSHFQKMCSGQKTAITRAATSDYRSIKVGDTVELIDNATSQRLFAEIKSSQFYENLRELFDDSNILEAAFAKRFDSQQELEHQYEESRPGYLQEIANEGVVAWRIEIIKQSVPVPDEDLPVVLPEMKSYEPSGDGRSPLARVPEFVNTTCPKCGGPAERETDTMDGFACSSWYFLRFADPHNNKKAFDDAKVKYWLPVDDYIGGAEHAVMHLLYARMWTKVMFDEGLINFNEPFKTLRNHGMILAPDGRKMSKSFGNVIAPDEIIEQGYGADSIRIMELFIGPWNQTANWSVEGMGGSFRFLQRVWTLVQNFNASNASGNIGEQQPYERQINQVIHRTIKKVSQDLESLSFNTAIAAMMEATNEFYKLKDQDHFANVKAWRFALKSLLQLLAPFAPHIAEELWAQLGHEGSIHISEWPKYDEQYLTTDTLTIVVQENGKVRDQIEVAVDADETTVLETARAREKVQARLEGKEIVKTIYVPGKILNLVVR